MYIASAKRKENIAEYLLYMWQIEDIIRANNLDIDKIKSNIIDKFDLNDDQRKELTEWYESLIDMMCDSFSKCLIYRAYHSYIALVKCTFTVMKNKFYKNICFKIWKIK